MRLLHSIISDVLIALFQFATNVGSSFWMTNGLMVILSLPGVLWSEVAVCSDLRWLVALSNTWVEFKYWFLNSSIALAILAVSSSSSVWTVELLSCFFSLLGRSCVKAVLNGSWSGFSLLRRLPEGWLLIFVGRLVCMEL